MSDLPERSDTIYKEIESFEDYELIQCVAYEMAIRNNHVIELKNDINKLLSITLTEYKHTRDNDDEFNIRFNKLCDEYYEKYDDDDYDNDELEEPDYRKHFLSENKHTMQIKEKLNLLIHDYWIRYFYEEDIIDEAFYRNNKDDNNEPYLSYKQNKKLKEHNFIGAFEHVGMSKDNRVVVSNDIGFAFGTSGNTDKEIDLNKILISQRIDSLVVPKEHDISINIKINLSLPLSELEAYIKKLKENYNADNGMIKTPAELAGKDLEVTDNKNMQKKPLSTKYADWFYIYDYWKFQKKLNISDDEIFIDIELTNDDFYKKDNIRKIRDKMKYFIEKLGYKELITGVKIS